MNYFIYLRGCAFLYSFFNSSNDTWVYISVVATLSWPSSFCMEVRSALLLSIAVANECLSTCGLFFLMVVTFERLSFTIELSSESVSGIPLSVTKNAVPSLRPSPD